ncbi:MAG: MFS transporter [Desulfobacterales bacterium]
MLSSAKMITASSFGAMFFLGVGTAVIGAASKNIGLTPQQIGLLIAVQNLGFILSVTVAGTLADTFSKTKLMFGTSLILAVSFYLFYILYSFIFSRGNSAQTERFLRGGDLSSILQLFRGDTQCTGKLL